MKPERDGHPREPLDLYARLGLEGPDDRVALISALDSQASEPRIRQVAAFIFHDDQRRQEHDDWWRTLSAVSILRTQLGLSAAVHWNRQPNGDFARIEATEARMREAMPTEPLSANAGAPRRPVRPSATSRDGRARR